MGDNPLPIRKKRPDGTTRELFLVNCGLRFSAAVNFKTRSLLNAFLINYEQSCKIELY